MSLRSRVLRSKLLRLCRRGMRLVLRGVRNGTPPRPFAAAVGRLIWRRVRASRLERADGHLPWLHQHRHHVLRRSDIRVAVELCWVTRKAAPSGLATSAHALPLSTPSTAPVVEATRRSWHALLTRPSRHQRLPPTHSPLALSTRARPVTPSVGLSTCLDRRVAAEGGPTILRRVGPALRSYISQPGIARRSVEQMVAIARIGRHQRHAVALRREPAFSGRALDRGNSFGYFRELRRPATEPVAHSRDYAGAIATTTAKYSQARREPSPVPLHYARGRSAPTPVERTPASTAPTRASPPTRVPQTNPTVSHVAPAQTLDRVVADRLADEVIRRIERRVRLERERRGV